MTTTNLSQSTLIKNANIFDGTGGALAKGMSLLVEGNKIAKVAKSIKAPAGATAIDATGPTITPGYSEDQANKHRQAFAGIDNMFKIAKKIGKNITK